MDKQYVIRHSASDAIRLHGQNAIEEYTQILKTLTPRELAIHYVLRLRRLDIDYSEAIPQRIVHSTDFQFYKCRKTWFGTLSNWLDIIKKHGLMEKDLADKSESFQEKTIQGLGNRLTTQKDVEEGTSILRETINNLTAKFDIKREEL